MTHRKIVFFSIIEAAAAIALTAQRSSTEAPAGFTTPALGQTVGPTGDLTSHSDSQSVKQRDSRAACPFRRPWNPNLIPTRCIGHWRNGDSWDSFSLAVETACAGHHRRPDRESDVRRAD